MTAIPDPAPVGIICDIFRHTIDFLRSTVTRHLAPSQACYSHRFMRPLAYHDPYGPHSVERHFRRCHLPRLLRLHLESWAGLRPNVAIIDPHSVTHSIICDEAYRFRRFIVEDTKLLPCWETRSRARLHTSRNSESTLSISRIPRPNIRRFVAQT